ncbi:UNVERIFIED_CONTAM: winged helix-turn-helix transcriptional regulator [Bacillus sp. ATCC 13368]
MNWNYRIKAAAFCHKVEYSLTEQGESLILILDSMYNWVKLYGECRLGTSRKKRGYQVEKLLLSFFLIQRCFLLFLYLDMFTYQN